jgi:hypothetical protein
MCKAESFLGYFGCLEKKNVDMGTYTHESMEALRLCFVSFFFLNQTHSPLKN